MHLSQENIQELLNLYSSKEFKLAEIKTRELMYKHTNDVILYNILGMVLAGQNKLDETIVCYQKAIKIKPDFVETYNNFGNALKTFGQMERALNNYKKALQLRPNFIEARFNLGIICEKLGEYDKAIKSFKEVLKIKPDFAQAHNNLGKIFITLNRINDAISNYQSALKIEPHLTEAHMHLSFITKYTKDSHPHIQEMEKAISNINIKDDQKKYLAFGLGKAFDETKNYEKAFKYFEEGNSLKKKQLGYSLKSDISLFKNLKDVFQTSLFDKFKDSGSLDKSAIFILGMPRSGTTLIEQILSSHPKVYAGGELTAIEDKVKQYFSSNNAINFSDNLLSCDSSKLQQFGNDYIKEVRKLSNDTRYITDKLPLNFLWIGLIKLVLPNSKIIHCSRDPRDTCFSIFKTHFGTSGNKYAYDLVDLGNYYNLYLDLMKHWHTVLPDYIYDVSYKQLISNQKEQTQKLLNACNLEWNENCMKFYKNIRPVKTASKTQVRLPIYQDSINSWKNYKKYLKPLLEILSAN